MRQSENITELYKNLVQIQSEIPTMPKSSQAYGYKYADLDTITTIIKPILAKYGVAYMQTLAEATDGKNALTTRIFNTKGEFIEDTAMLPEVKSAKNNEAQTLGMAITYMRRYALCAMLGITSDEDTDANTQNQPQKQWQKPTSAPTNVPQNQPQYQQQAPTQRQVFKGGDATESEKAMLKSLLSTTYPNGQAIFTENEKMAYSKRRTELTAKELIDVVQKDLNTRRTPNGQLQATSTQDIY